MNIFSSSGHKPVHCAPCSRTLLQLPFLLAIPAFNMVFNDLRQAAQQVDGNDLSKKSNSIPIACFSNCI
jgi:hypothetical protein